MNKYEVLKKYFGYSSFRDNQEIIIDSLINKKDTIVVMPTGGGKSLCFQIPALVFLGMTIVITPLISLMNDQVRELKEKNISCAYINSSLDYYEVNDIKEKILNNEIKILYLSPERLSSEFMLEVIKKVKIDFLVIDEAHTILWHLDFRKSFLDIKEFILSIRDDVVVGCFTATANTKTLDEILKVVPFKKYNIYKSNFDREELFYEVVKNIDKKKYLLSLLKNNDKSIIIYCLTRKRVMELYNFLKLNNINCVYYHGGLDNEIKEKNQNLFMKNTVNIIICTISFGMGINKPDIRYVINYDIPSSLEDLAQMTGRCSRDKAFGKCIILYDKKDILTSRYYIDSITFEDKTFKELVRIKRYKLLQLKSVINFCETKVCLHKYLASYFENNISSCLKKCSNCLK